MDRQTIMETNRSLRTIKNELENLLEKGIINEDAFDTIHAALPAETPLRGAGLAATRSGNSTPASTQQPTAPPAQPAAAAAAPPSYDDTPAPGLPSRSTKPVLAYARALYLYNPSDKRDLQFNKDDSILVNEYMNQDWWMGRNERTGEEGIFPRSYVFVDPAKVAPPSGVAPNHYQQPVYGYPAPQGPPPQQNPYNSSVPPMAVAEGGQPAQGGEGSGKVGEYGKKFGKKLGNAAIFGAGASIGSNLVNSIF